MASKSSLVISFFAFLSAWIVGVLLAKMFGWHYTLLTLNLTTPLELAWMGLVMAVFTLLFFGRLGFLFFLALGFVQAAKVSFSGILLVLSETIVLVWFGLLGVLIGELLFDDLAKKTEFNLLNRKIIAVFLIGIALAIFVSASSQALVYASQNGVVLAKDFRQGKFSFEKLFGLFEPPLNNVVPDAALNRFLTLSEKSSEVNNLESFSEAQTRTVWLQSDSAPIQKQTVFLKYENSFRIEEISGSDSNTWFDYNGTAIFCEGPVDADTCRKTDRESLEQTKVRALQSFVTNWDSITREFFLQKSRNTAESDWFWQLNFRTVFSVTQNGEIEIAGRACERFDAQVNGDKTLQKLAEVSQNPGMILDSDMRQNFPAVSPKICLDSEYGVVLSAELDGLRTSNNRLVSQEKIDTRFKPLAAESDVIPPLLVRNVR
ncbi:MAG: hypothetical protein V1777_01730 [Candidatus Micrarchaeota archaeon]